MTNIATSRVGHATTPRIVLNTTLSLAQEGRAQKALALLR
jgi:hypothetical protein